jgi:hypothetical protein
LIIFAHGVRIRNGSFLLKGAATMYDRATILHLVHDAEQHSPSCTCGEPMLATDRDGALVLECAALRRRADASTSTLRSLLDRIRHDRRVIVDREELAAA